MSSPETPVETTQEVTSESHHPVLHSAIRLGAFAVIAAVIVGFTHSGTSERIAFAEAQVKQQALLEVVDSLSEKNINLLDLILVPDHSFELLGLDVDEDENIQVVRNNAGIAIAFIVPAVAPDGYSGDIDLLVGLDLQGQITGVREISHAETPGLGDKIDSEKSDWILGFNGKSLDNPLNGWAVKKDGGEFDAFTGATITPRAVVNKVQDVLLFYRSNAELLIGTAGQRISDDLSEDLE